MSQTESATVLIRSACWHRTVPLASALREDLGSPSRRRASCTLQRMQRACNSQQARASSSNDTSAMLVTTASESPEERPEAPEHLVLMVNGLFGSTENWSVVQRNLATLARASKILMVASNANLKLQTFEGIDNCGNRLASELQDCIAANPSLIYISIIGHSMGGLIARYTIGKLFDPATGLIAGLKPRHFISLATPHLGCGGEGPAQVPFIGWTEEVPVVGGYATKALQYWANSFASVVLRRTGEQFFLLDGSLTSDPLLVQMAEDSEEGHFFSALRAFASRTCYANSSGDHIVGWANSSVRHPDELPDLGDLVGARGVVRADTIQRAIDLPERGSEGEPLRLSNSRKSSGSNESVRSAVEKAESEVESSAAVVRILRQLQRLPWCRVDTSFKGTAFPYFAHNLIQVTREWLNWEGESVVQHLAHHFSDLEEAAPRSELSPLSRR